MSKFSERKVEEAITVRSILRSGKFLNLAGGFMIAFSILVAYGHTIFILPYIADVASAGEEMLFRPLVFHMNVAEWFRVWFLFVVILVAVPVKIFSKRLRHYKSYIPHICITFGVLLNTYVVSMIFLSFIQYIILTMPAHSG
ncbi:hypothetical protein QA601_02885 [Chitinispirillales bacterium ANBcel5]|uniref:hypothetical protein n=1 Tax=Cellulosispirillum alkaliphilum TaxID=3039283 RepID=UPI002A57CDA9|nr:hypothetical protein [Chitinispirillales bacterium ANBcel5]